MRHRQSLLLETSDAYCGLAQATYTDAIAVACSYNQPPRRLTAFEAEFLSAIQATRNQRIRRCSGAAVAASGTPTFGVHHRTALVACQVIANNAFDTGCFTLDGDGLQRLNIPPDGILTGGKYYLILGEGPSLYPIMPSFLDWEFAYGRIPEPWNQAPVTASSTTSDCAVTNYSLCTEQAHIVPREEETWYVRNGMGIYGANLGDINEATNVLPLRSDIHKCFDNRWFVIVPKTAGTEVSTPAALHSPQFVTHILSTEIAQYWPTYHNTLVQHLQVDCSPYLFARFAWAVLLHVKFFINSGHHSTANDIQ
ncbi:hypothetical protein I7I51_01059 [Histoplasma capsulatum]|uniref:HNH nuclease domain-containing protein n=1 Tax=Ajellomyces capsulatus TaxID=5037 RepID=A0A8A1MBP5_AJECA|nr:hypothetical protein I7I51_01059 [Histoplasma capsulatum]